MNLTSVRFKSALYLLLYVVLFVDIVLYRSDRVLHDHLSHDPIYLYQNSSHSIGFPSGYLRDGDKVSASTSGDAGVVVRFSARNCPHCKKDEPKWLELVAKLRRKHFIALTLPVSAQESYPANSPALASGYEMAYVDTSWIRPLQVRGTPTVIILSQSKGPIWGHEGELNEDDILSALKTIDAH